MDNMLISWNNHGRMDTSSSMDDKMSCLFKDFRPAAIMDMGFRLFPEILGCF